jgi:rubredoxin
MDTYICRMCGHIYDPAKGEVKKYTILLTGVGEGTEQPQTTAGAYIKTGIEFSALPEDWKCPVCGAKKAYFQKTVPERLAGLRTIS